MRNSRAIIALAAGLAFAAPAAAEEDHRFALTPYVWLPNVEGDLRFDIPPGAGGSPDVSVGPVDYLENLDMAMMLKGEARFGRASILTDVIYLDFSNENASVRSVGGPGPIEIPIDIGTQVELNGWLWTLAGGYDLLRREHVTLQAFAGFRYLGLDATLNWRLAGPLNLLPQSGSVARGVDVWDGLVGVRGEGLSGKWVFPYYLDVGTGDSEFTWQGAVGVGYRFGWGDLGLDYRHLHYEQEEGGLLQDMAFSGPALSATFRF